MLDELLDRIANGGLTIEVIDLNKTLGKKNRPAWVTDAMDILEWMKTTEDKLYAMCRIFANHDHPERAERVKAWWIDLVEPIITIVDEIPDDFDVEAEETQASLTRLIAEAKSIRETGDGVLREIIHRQCQALAAADISDLLS